MNSSATPLQENQRQRNAQSTESNIIFTHKDRKTEIVGLWKTGYGLRYVTEGSSDKQPQLGRKSI